MNLEDRRGQYYDRRPHRRQPRKGFVRLEGSFFTFSNGVPDDGVALAVPPAYRFLDRWVVPAPVEQVYDVIGDPLGYERWWTDFVIEASGDAGPPRRGKKNELLVKAYLPYKVNFGLEVLEAEAPRRIFSRLSKDFDGSGEWTLVENDGATEATLDWRPSVNHPLIKYLTPLLRPLFRSNHNWAMRRGERQLREYLRRE